MRVEVSPDGVRYLFFSSNRRKSNRGGARLSGRYDKVTISLLLLALLTSVIWLISLAVDVPPFWVDQTAKAGLLFTSIAVLLNIRLFRSSPCNQLHYDRKATIIANLFLAPIVVMVADTWIY